MCISCFIKKILFKFCRRIGVIVSTAINNACPFFLHNKSVYFTIRRGIIVPSYGCLSLGLIKNVCRAIMTVQDHRLYSDKG